jgi:hypothetical protein
VAYNVPNWSLISQKTALLGAAAGADVVISTDAGNPTQTELVVTTSAIDGGRYLLRKTDIYYLEPEDVPLFLRIEKQGTPVKELRVVGAR